MRDRKLAVLAVLGILVGIILIINAPESNMQDPEGDSPMGLVGLLVAILSAIWLIRIYLKIFPKVK